MANICKYSSKIHSKTILETYPGRVALLETRRNWRWRRGPFISSFAYSKQVSSLPIPPRPQGIKSYMHPYNLSVLLRYIIYTLLRFQTLILPFLWSDDPLIFLFNSEEIDILAAFPLRNFVCPILDPQQISTTSTHHNPLCQCPMPGRTCRWWQTWPNGRWPTSELVTASSFLGKWFMLFSLRLAYGTKIPSHPPQHTKQEHISPK